MKRYTTYRHMTPRHMTHRHTTYQRTTHRRTTHRQRGAVLPIVLLSAMMLLATSAAWFDTSIAATRGAANLRDQLRAFHAADAALTRCARGVVGGLIAPAGSATGSEPIGWKSESTFDANAIVPFAQWPGVSRAPQCLVEAWRIASRPDARVFLLTARGFGRSRDTQAWAQVQLVIDGETVERHWRRVAARRF